MLGKVMVECWTPAQYIWVNILHSASWAALMASVGFLAYLVKRWKKAAAPPEWGPPVATSCGEAMPIDAQLGRCGTVVLCVKCGGRPPVAS